MKKTLPKGNKPTQTIADAADAIIQTEAHYQNVAATRDLVNILIEKLTCQIVTPLLEGSQPLVEVTHAVALWGEKENAVSLLVKLTGLLLKLIPLEQVLLERCGALQKVTIAKDNAPEQYSLPFNVEDEAILARYIGKVQGIAPECTYDD